MVILARASIMIAGGIARDFSETASEPPAHLGEPEQQIWREVLRDYRGTNAALAVLASGLESHMRAPMPRGYCRGWHDGARQGRSTEAASVACRRARRNARLSANVQGARDQILTEMRRASSRELGPYRRHELLTGECVYAVQGYTGYGSAARARPISSARA